MEKEKNSNYEGIAKLSLIIRIGDEDEKKKRQVRWDKKREKQEEEERNKNEEQGQEKEEDERKEQEEEEQREEKEDKEGRDRKIEMLKCDLFCEDIHVLGGSFIVEIVEKEVKRIIMMKMKEDAINKKKTVEIEIKGSYR